MVGRFSRLERWPETENRMIGVLMCQHPVCSTITQFVAKQCKSLECCLRECVFVSSNLYV